MTCALARAGSSSSNNAAAAAAVAAPRVAMIQDWSDKKGGAEVDGERGRPSGANGSGNGESGSSLCRHDAGIPHSHETLSHCSSLCGPTWAIWVVAACRPPANRKAPVRHAAPATASRTEE
eukprot:362077-Chlamydomonas_euryale.AAC.12